MIRSMLRLSLLLFLGWTISCGGAAATVKPPTPPLVPTTSPTEVADPTPTISPDIPLVRVDGAEFPVELAATPEQRSQGLSGRDSLSPGTGMLFIFETEGNYTFWMKDMRFPLDLIWISAECVLAEVVADAPPPEPGQSPNDLPRYTPSVPARYVLEINAGEAAAADIDPGDPVEFAGSLLRTYGCRPG